MAPPRRPGKKKKQPKPAQRKYILTAVGDKVVINCPQDKADNCFEGRLLETTRPTEFHDIELVRATKQINQILSRVRRNSRSNDNEISFINFQSRIMLVWSTHSSIDNSDDTKVARVLHLKKISSSHLH